MKYLVLVPDGMSDLPLEALGGKTPLQVASTPAMDWLAQRGECGWTQTVPDGFEPGSDVAALSILGYDPEHCYTGRSPLEAASMRITLGADDVAFRCNLVSFTTRNGNRLMDDYSAGHITSEEASELIQAVNDELGDEEISFFPGKMYRHLMVWHGGPPRCGTTAPHDIPGEPISTYWPAGDGAERLRQLTERSFDILAQHPVNERRRQQGKGEASSIWLWGEGRAPHLTPFADKYGIHGGIISAVDLVQGIGIHAQMRQIDVPGIMGFTDTNYEGKADYALEAFNDLDLVYLHVEATDETGHMGDVDGKIGAIEAFDRRVVQRLLENIHDVGAHRILLLPDHATPVMMKTHTADPVPVVIYTSTREVQGAKVYDEQLLQEGTLSINPGYQTMEYFLSVKN